MFNFKTCWTCEHFGKCRVDVKVCPDWVKYTGNAIVGNLGTFSQQWIKRHKKWYNKCDIELIVQRNKALMAYLKGKSEQEAATQAMESMIETTIEKLR